MNVRWGEVRTHSGEPGMGQAETGICARPGGWHFCSSVRGRYVDGGSRWYNKGQLKAQEKWIQSNLLETLILLEHPRGRSPLGWSPGRAPKRECVCSAPWLGGSLGGYEEACSGDRKYGDESPSCLF